MCWEATRDIMMMRRSQRVCQTPTRPARLVLARHCLFAQRGSVLEPELTIRSGYQHPCDTTST
jgi:hypothetical protein